MTLQPGSLDELTAFLAEAAARGTAVSSINLTAFSRLLEYNPADMTVTVEAGMTLAGLQRILAEQRQWLPLDPPDAEQRTIAALLNENLCGPRRFGYGTIRDHLIGLKAVLADGRLVRSGGKVVKNVAGFDLQKLFIGAQGTLGVIVEATFKVMPLPEHERIIAASLDSVEAAAALIEAVLGSELTPVILDLHQLPRSRISLVLGFAGTREEVDWQLARATTLGVSEPAGLDYEGIFWNREPAPKRASVLPSRIAETIRALRPDEFVARAGNGVIAFRGGALPSKTPPPAELTRRVKEAFDPKHLFPGLNL